MNGILYIVATPIGNLEDITLRALRVLKEVDLILCEDTRVTRRLLSKYEIATPVKSYHQHTSQEKGRQIIDEILSGKNLALVTDAGTPGVSDPGNILVEMAVENAIQVVPVPGASALAALVSVAGIDMQKFTFLGFPPHKKGRETFFKEVAASKYPVMYYESPHRVLKNLELLQSLGADKRIILGRELTKVFEETVRGDVSEVIEYYKSNSGKVKGEFVIIAH
ncbi:MAG TPA: 16S rRNA (cytidine(1402)-2'-O)-methyltransferase [Candidatus Moranbacteria bacterium]|nr:MAG: Ribosomal RNA small subunit methyltransferase I [Parcubacteria group bacterium GW2011_GWC1_45_14]HAV11614.1 16S rRNA (cytidine(1402)-2'-O)-methyltransferase [Candidatus Moranbacteria bacterium]